MGRASPGTATNITGTSATPAVVTGNKTNNNAAPGATNVGVLPGIASAAAPTWTEGNQVLESMDLSGNQRQTLGTLITGENQTTNRLNNEPIYSYVLITTATTTVVKSGAGTLHTINLTGGTAGTITVYDNTAGSGTQILLTTSSNNPICYLLDASFSTGCTIVTSAATNLTVAFR